MCPQEVEVLRFGLHIMGFMTFAEPVSQQLQAPIPLHWLQKNRFLNVRPNLGEQEVDLKMRMQGLSVMNGLLDNIQPYLCPRCSAMMAQETKDKASNRHTPFLGDILMLLRFKRAIFIKNRKSASS